MPEFKQSAEKSGQYRLPIDELYPDLTLEQQREAEYFLERYLEIIHRIYEETGDLTSSDLNTTV